MSDAVECHSEFTYPEKPVALTWEGRRFEIETVLASWRTPQGPSFRVRTEDGQSFELAFTESTGSWDVRHL